MVVLILYGHKGYFEYPYHITKVYSEGKQIILEASSNITVGRLVEPAESSIYELVMIKKQVGIDNKTKYILKIVLAKATQSVQ